LDSLGNNQVFEKEQAGFTAINLYKLNFNKKAADDIAKGVYHFVYMSPEIFLNNKMWENVYLSLTFQNRLGLVALQTFVILPKEKLMFGLSKMLNFFNKMAQ
jgi:superfamily II DNA helicase RecQ